MWRSQAARLAIRSPELNSERQDARGKRPTSSRSKESKKGKFEPEQFEDEYENALKELLRKKQKGERIERPKEPARTNVVNLMEALW
jgi:non-homologous end joining protein Ku